MLHVSPLRYLDRINTFFLDYKFALYLFVLILLFIKDQHQFIHPQFWAEDGAVFFADAYNYGWHSLFMSYAGYLNILIRLVANFAIYIPYFYNPLVFAYVSALAVLFTNYCCLSKRLNLPYQTFLALAVILVPTYGEVFMTLTNIQWILAPVLFLYSLYAAPKKLREIIGDGLVILLIGLTGPFIFLVYPLYVWRFIQDRRTLVWLVYATLACGLQIFITHVVFHPVLNDVVSPGAYINPRWYSAFGGRFFADIFYYGWLHHLHLGVVLTLLAWLLPLYCTFFLIANEYRRAAICFYYFWLVCVFAMFVRMTGASVIVGPESISGDRYVYLPTLALAWLLILGLKNHGRKFCFAFVLLMMMLVQSLCIFPDMAKKFIDMDWAKYSGDIKSGVPINIPINPVMANGTTFKINLN